MNFNKEIARELEELNLGGNIVEIDTKDKGTPEDWVALEREIAYRVHENEIMMAESELIAARSAL